MYFDFEVYSKLIDLELKTMSNSEPIKRATQKDIDIFLL